MSKPTIPSAKTTRVTIQIALIGGGYHVNEYRGQDETLVLIGRGSFRILRKAVDRAIETVAAKLAAEAVAAQEGAS